MFIKHECTDEEIKEMRRKLNEACGGKDIVLNWDKDAPIPEFVPLSPEATSKLDEVINNIRFF